MTIPNCHVIGSDPGKWPVPLRDGAGILGKGFGEEPEPRSSSLDHGTSPNASEVPHINAQELSQGVAQDRHLVNFLFILFFELISQTQMTISMARAPCLNKKD